MEDEAAVKGDATLLGGGGQRGAGGVEQTLAFIDQPVDRCHYTRTSAASHRKERMEPEKGEENAGE